MTKLRIVIHEGMVGAFADEIIPTISIQDTRRVSRILPVNWWIYIAFRVLRRCVIDDSLVAAWTRTWRCRWYVEILGKRHTTVFTTRAAAIDYEKQCIRESTVIQKYLSGVSMDTFTIVETGHEHLH
ncbi:MAG: hypothetical protein ACR2PS_03085 [Pseudomonadales bacterium]